MDVVEVNFAFFNKCPKVELSVKLLRAAEEFSDGTVVLRHALLANHLVVSFEEEQRDPAVHILHMVLEVLGDFAKVLPVRVSLVELLH